MPRPKRECGRPGCRVLTERAYCPKHRADGRQYDNRRASPSKRGYGREWAKIRKAQILNFPFCRRCLRGGVHTAANEVDHIVPMAEGGDHDAGNLQSLCKRHHTEKTNAYDGGLGRERLNRAIEGIDDIIGPEKT